MADKLPINVYIDGFNFYYAISKTSRRDLQLLKRGWCNLWLLGQRLVDKAFPGSSMGAVKYFTAAVGDLELRPEEARRQALWLEALRAGTGNRVRIVHGFYAQEEGKQRVEKQTDVNIAISMVRDAIVSGDRRAATNLSDPFAPCGGIVLVSADRDLEPALRMAAAYGVRPVRFRPGRELTDEDLWATALPESIQRDNAPPITWKEYSILKSGNSRW
jgi:hypothetical protein